MISPWNSIPRPVKLSIRCQGRRKVFSAIQTSHKFHLLRHSFLKVTEECTSPKPRCKSRKWKAWIQRPQALTEGNGRKNSQNHAEGKSEANAVQHTWRATVPTWAWGYRALGFFLFFFNHQLLDVFEHTGIASRKKLQTNSKLSKKQKPRKNFNSKKYNHRFNGEHIYKVIIMSTMNTDLTKYDITTRERKFQVA